MELEDLGFDSDNSIPWGAVVTLSVLAVMGFYYISWVNAHDADLRSDCERSKDCSTQIYYGSNPEYPEEEGEEFLRSSPSQEGSTLR